MPPPTILSLNFSEIERESGKSTAEAIRLLWQLVSDLNQSLRKLTVRIESL